VWPKEEGGGGTINVWTAFTEANEQNGCLLFVPGTHREMHFDESKGMTFDPERNRNVLKGDVPRGFTGYDYRELQKDPHWKPDESRAICMVMKPGEFIMFRSTLLHASKPNSTKDSPRLGYVARYVPSRVKVYPDTDVVSEFGGEISLRNYGTVVVAGSNVEPTNRVRTENLRGQRFSRLE
jgi:non-heme Fe2+,alpha-ketoglutarate-dependent halogenase